MKKTLLIYYSHGGTTKHLAEELKNELKLDSHQLELENDLQGMFKMVFKIPFLMMFKKCPALKPINIDFDHYDNIIIGMPVWMATFAAPIRTFIQDTNLSGKNIALFCSSGTNPGHVFADFKSLLPDNDYVSELKLKNAESNLETSAVKLKGWASELF